MATTHEGCIGSAGPGSEQRSSCLGPCALARVNVGHVVRVFRAHVRDRVHDGGGEHLMFNRKVPND